MDDRKPLGIKNYGSIPHMNESRLGPSDSKIGLQQELHGTGKLRRGDMVIVTEKIDGSNVGVARVNGEIIPLTRAGYVASTSPYKMHHIFYDWAVEQRARFLSMIEDGERVVGEWCIQAHGTIYAFPREPFFLFDIFNAANHRLTYAEMLAKNSTAGLPIPNLIHRSQTDGITVTDFLRDYPANGYHGADECEGAVWRLETNMRFNFIMKFVKPWKEDGKYLDREIYNAWVAHSAVLDTIQTSAGGAAP
jgi:hypothetical protein